MRGLLLPRANDLLDRLSINWQFGKQMDMMRIDGDDKHAVTLRLTFLKQSSTDLLKQGSWDHNRLRAVLTNDTM